METDGVGRLVRTSAPNSCVAMRVIIETTASQREALRFDGAPVAEAVPRRTCCGVALCDAALIICEAATIAHVQ